MWFRAHLLVLLGISEAFQGKSIPQRMRGSSTTLGFSGADGLDLNYVEVSNPSNDDHVRPPIIMLHGLLGQSRNFKAWAQELHALHLDEEHRLFLVDLRNHGLCSVFQYK